MNTTISATRHKRQTAHYIRLLMDRVGLTWEDIRHEEDGTTSVSLQRVSRHLDHRAV